MYNNAFDEWARALIGSPKWRSAAAAASEFGWRLSGFGRALVDMAVRRARLFALPTDDIYRKVCVYAHDATEQTWAKRNRALLLSRGIQDWTD